MNNDKFVKRHNNKVNVANFNTSHFIKIQQFNFGLV